MFLWWCIQPPSSWTITSFHTRYQAQIYHPSSACFTERTCLHGSCTPLPVEKLRVCAIIYIYAEQHLHPVQRRQLNNSVEPHLHLVLNLITRLNPHLTRYNEDNLITSLNLHFKAATLHSSFSHSTVDLKSTRSGILHCRSAELLIGITSIMWQINLTNKRGLAVLTFTNHLTQVRGLLGLVAGPRVCEGRESVSQVHPP